MEEQAKTADLKQDMDTISLMDTRSGLSQLGRITFDELIAEIRF